MFYQKIPKKKLLSNPPIHPQKYYFSRTTDRPIKTTARIIAATSVNLGQKLEDNSFRKDLYFRLRAHHLHIPPLRERLGDIRYLFDQEISHGFTRINTDSIFNYPRKSVAKKFCRT